MLKFKVWILNLKRISESGGSNEWEQLNELWSGRTYAYDYFKVFDNNPDHHMLYSTKYLEETSVLKLLRKHYQYQSMFRCMKVKNEW